jgi:hypothetical protein
MNIPDYFTESLKAVFWFKILKIFDADPEAGIRNLFDPGSVMGFVPRMSALFFHRPPICGRATDHTYTKGCSHLGKKCGGTK